MYLVILLYLFVRGLVWTQDSYLRYYPPFVRDDFSHYGKEVECYTGIGANYAGNQNYTNSGKPCVDWKQTKYSDKASCVYCRNPNSNSRGPWCYTDGLGERESCRVLIPKCGPVYQFRDGGRVTVETHTWSPSNTSDLSVSFKPDNQNQTEHPGSYTVVSIPGHLNTSIIIIFEPDGQAGGRVVLKWRYLANIEPITLKSNVLLHTHYRVEIYREDNLLQMKVNSNYYVLQKPVPGFHFDFRGRMHIGHDPDTREWFKGCITNLQYNGVRPLDKLDDWIELESPPHVTVYGSVSRTEDCMYVAPSNFRGPGYSAAGRAMHQLVGLLLPLVVIATP